MTNEKRDKTSREEGVKEAIYSNLIAIESMFTGRRDLDNLYLDIKGERVISDEELKDLDVQHAIATILYGIDSFINSGNDDYGTRLGENVSKLLRTKSLSTYFINNRSEFSLAFSEYYDKNIAS